VLIHLLDSFITELASSFSGHFLNIGTTDLQM